jgi:hypothetical protein
VAALTFGHEQAPVSDPHIGLRRPRTSQRRSPASTIASTIDVSRSVRSAASSRSTSPGAKIFGSVRGTRTSGTVRDRFEPPCRRVDKPRGTGLARTGVSPRAIR